MHILSFPLGPIDTNCYILHNGKEAVVIDPGGDVEKILKTLKENNLTLTHILNTHLHFDHTYGNAGLAKATGAKIFSGAQEKEIEGTELTEGGVFGCPLVDRYEWEELEPGEHTFMGLSCKVMHTPGHTPGSLVFYFKDAKVAFVGDVIFLHSIGRTDFPGGDYGDLINSIRDNIFTLPPETVLYSGHGPSTTVEEEKRGNPYIS